MYMSIEEIFKYLFATLDNIQTSFLTKVCLSQ